MTERIQSNVSFSIVADAIARNLGREIVLL